MVVLEQISTVSKMLQKIMKNKPLKLASFLSLWLALNAGASKNRCFEPSFHLKSFPQISSIKSSYPIANLIVTKECEKNKTSNYCSRTSCSTASLLHLTSTANIAPPSLRKANQQRPSLHPKIPTNCKFNSIIALYSNRTARRVYTVEHYNVTIHSYAQNSL